MQEYTIVKGTNEDKVSQIVTEHLEGGWKLVGGLSTSIIAPVNSDGDLMYMEVYYSQALSRE